MRLAERRAQQTRLLRLAPWNVFVSERAHETLKRLHAFVALLRYRSGTRNESSALRHLGGFRIEAGGHAVALHQLGEPFRVVFAIAEARHHPAPVLGMRNRWIRRNRFARVPAGLAQYRRAPPYPRHQIDFG